MRIWPWSELRLLDETLIRERLGHQEREQFMRDLLSQTALEIDVLKAKIERMEQVVMPLQSQAGAAYVSLGKPREKLPPEHFVSPVQSWETYLKAEMKRQEAEEKKDGVPS